MDIANAGDSALLNRGKLGDQCKQNLQTYH